MENLEILPSQGFCLILKKYFYEKYQTNLF